MAVKIDVNLKLLRAFCAVAEHNSFSRAATDLGRSQATISVQVRELERQLNVKLLERTTRRVFLTEAGTCLADAAQQGLSTIDKGIQAARSIGESRRSRIVLACVPSISSSQLPAILASYRLKDLSTRIDVEELTSSEIVAALMESQVDFGIGPCIEPSPPEIRFVGVVDDPLYVVLTANSGFTNCQGVDFDKLAKLPLITLSGSVLLQNQLEIAADKADIDLKTLTEVRHVQTAIAMARAGVGAAVVPRLALPDPFPEGVQILPITNPTMARRVGVITKAGTQLGKAAVNLVRHIRWSLSKTNMDERNAAIGTRAA